MQYRHLSYRYVLTMRSGQVWPAGEIWPSERPRVLVESRWRPDADTYETTNTVEIIVDLAGVDEDDFEVQLFEDALVITGVRQPPSSAQGAIYHAVSIRQGPFRVELPLTTPVEPERVVARLDRGLLRVTLPKRAEAD